MSRVLYVFVLCLLATGSQSVPADYTEEPAEESDETTTESGNDTAQNLYVIKTVVYEVGILTDAGNDTDASNETHEQVDVSFFNPSYNGSFFDLSNIPIPIQTNVSGISVTGILPANLGAINLTQNGTALFNGTNDLILPSQQVKVTHNISTVDKGASASILSGIPQILGLDKLLKNDSQTDVKEQGSS